MTKAAELAKMGEVLTNSQIGGRRNIVINGGMNVAQRSSSAVTGIGASDGYFTCDRWNFNTNGNSAGRLTMSQASDGPSGFANCLKLECTTADTSIAAAERFFIEQKLEGQDVQQLKKGTSDAEKITISFYVKGHDSATYTVGLYEGTSGRKIAATFPVTTSWVRQTVTFDGDTSGVIPDDNTAQLHLRFYLHAGSNYTSGTLGTSWNADGNTTQISSDGNSFFESTSATFFLTGVQLEVGSVATPFEHASSFGEQLSLCQRYFYKWINTGLDDNFNFYSPYSPAQVSAGLPNSSAICPMTFPVTMRASPTMATTISGGTLNRQTSTPFGFVAQMGTTSTGTHYPTQYLADAEL